jgi:hypothetical protein
MQVNNGDFNDDGAAAINIFETDELKKERKNLKTCKVMHKSSV